MITLGLNYVFLLQIFTLCLEKKDRESWLNSVLLTSAEKDGLESGHDHKLRFMWITKKPRQNESHMTKVLDCTVPSLRIPHKVRNDI